MAKSETQFLLLFRGGEAGMDALSEGERAAHMQAWGAWMGELARAGVLRGGDRLATRGTTILGRDAQRHETPFADRAEQVGGYVILGSSTESTVLDYANRCPVLETGGSVEIRPTFS